MTPQNNLDLRGNFLTHPFAEMLAEILHARLTGSLRVSNEDKKCIVYFNDGHLAFAVSNSRSARLSEALLRQKKIEPAVFTTLPKFSSDLEFAAILVEKAVFSKGEVDRLLADQIEAILVDVLSWPTGDWVFSPLARLKEGLNFEVDTSSLLIEYGRCLSSDDVLKRFRSLQESFNRTDRDSPKFELHPGEAYMLSKLTFEPVTAAEFITANNLPESATLHTLYTLWLGGLLVRSGWNPAFSDLKIAAINSARLELKKEAANIAPKPAEPVIEEKPEPDLEVETTAAAEITLEEYLERVEKADTYYDILGVDAKAAIPEMKQAYFGLAKMFHPDRHHTIGGDQLRRIQLAFTELAQAHETLKNPESREVYDYKMRKELTDREKPREAGIEGEPDMKEEQATASFDRGFGLLMDNDADAAMPFLARAVHFAPANARYHAYYGKALSSEEKNRHKAESEMQAAIKIDPNNATFRLLLVEFFIQYKLLKRAEGELNRLLAIFPTNREALDLLESLKQ